MSAKLDTGSTFAGYRIEAEIGRGGMGVVYRATDLQLERPVALKLIAPEYAEDATFRERFLRESRLAASLDHPAVVPIYEAGDSDGQLFIAMRYVGDRDFKTQLAGDGPLPPERALGVLEQVAHALDAAHEKGLVHRDVKPANVLLDERDHAYLTDFGLTKQLGGASTQTGQLMGTLDYLAPEQIRAEELDGRADQYALACCLYESLTGAPPFRRETEAQVLWAHVQEDPPTLADRPALDSVLAKGLAKDRAERYASCAELLAAARQALRLDAAEGMATIMFTDVEGSTALTTRLGDSAAKELIEGQRRIVQAQVAGHGGRVIDSIGDGFMIAFDSTRRALACAIAIQDALLEHARSDPERTLRLRIGLNVGEVLEREGHPFGAAVNAAARIGAVAKGGEVVVSDAVRQLAGTLPGVSFRDRGRVRLKGFSEPWRLYEVGWGEQATPRRAPLWQRIQWQRLRPRTLVALGAVILAGGVAAGLVELTGGASRQALLEPGAVGVIDSKTNRVVAALALAGSPTRLAAGGRSVWVGGDDSGTVAALDTSTRKATQLIATGGFPSDLAAGEGAVWVLDGKSGLVFKIDPAYGTATRTRVTAQNPAYDVSRQSFDAASIAAGAGSVWATDGTSKLVRLDPRTGKVVDRIDVGSRLNGVAAGAGGVWAISGASATAIRLDRRGRVTVRIPIASKPGFESPYPREVRVGEGYVWILNANTATVTKIDPEQRTVSATIPIGIDRGPARLAVGDGAAWIANGDGTLSRIDPSGSQVTTIAVGHRLEDVAVAGGSVWVTTGAGLSGGEAGTVTGGSVRALPTSSCSPIYYEGGGQPRYLIASDLPLQGTGTLIPQFSQAIQLVLEQRRFRAGDYRVGYQSCDDSTAALGAYSQEKCKANARAYARDTAVIGVIGAFNSACSFDEIPILNGAPHGPLAMISPTNTVVALTHPGSTSAEHDFYPTGIRNYVRISTTDNSQAAADAVLVARLHPRKIYVLHDDNDYGLGIARAFQSAAAKLGLAVAGSALFTYGSPSYAAIVAQARQAGPDVVFVGGYFDADPDSMTKLLKTLRAALPRAWIVAPDGFSNFDLLRKLAGRTAEGILVSTPGLPNDQLPNAGREFVTAFAKAVGETPGPYPAYAAQAAEVLLDAIGRSDGTRASVTKELFKTKVEDGILGSFSFDRYGDTTAGAITIYRIVHGRPTVFRVITPPRSLVG